ncbi:MAG: 3-keto-disaccharide hydrolase [Planctomycetota bacterium]
MNLPLRLRIALCVSVAVLICAGCVRHASLNHPPQGFESLFNGRDLEGWKRHDNLPGHGLAGKWTVQDGAIVGTQDPPGKGGFLTTLRKFRDFELMLETKIDWPFDSGVFLRVGQDGKSHQVTLDYRPGGEIGGIYCPWTQGFVHHCPEGIHHFRKDDWNSIRIICEGEPARIRVWLNATLITDFTHTKETTAGIPEEGTICLQVHPGGKGHEESKARFRNIFVREMPPGRI